MLLTNIAVHGCSWLYTEASSMTVLLCIRLLLLSRRKRKNINGGERAYSLRTLLLEWVVTHFGIFFGCSSFYPFRPPYVKLILLVLTVSAPALTVSTPNA